MTFTPSVVLLVIAAICFGLATFNVILGPLNLIALGLLFLTLSFLA